MKTFSVQLRLRRTTVEDCHVSVPVTQQNPPVTGPVQENDRP